jgi:hypothetical protein
MDITQLKSKIDASGKKIATLGQEYARAKDDVSARKVMVKMFTEVSQQTLLIGEQISQLDRNVKGMK